MGKKVVVLCLDVIMIAVFPRNIWWKTIPVSPKVRFCSYKDPRHLAIWTRLLSRKGFKMNKNNEVCSNHFKFGRPFDSHPHPTLFLKGYDREILTCKRKTPMDNQLNVRRRSRILTLNSARTLVETISIVETPKKLVWSFTVIRRSLLRPNTAQRSFFPFIIFF